VKPAYRGLDPRDNHEMHRVSQRFAGALLLSTGAARMFLRELEFDVVEFSRLKQRSVPSTLVRLHELFPLGSGADCPRAAFWLFEAPWALVKNHASSFADYQMKYWGSQTVSRRAGTGLSTTSCATISCRSTGGLYMMWRSFHML
jgi:hypothetical protein